MWGPFEQFEDVFIACKPHCAVLCHGQKNTNTALYDYLIKLFIIYFILQYLLIRSRAASFNFPRSNCLHASGCKATLSWLNLNLYSLIFAQFLKQMSDVDRDFRQAPPSAVFHRNQSGDVGNLTRRLRSLSHLSEAVRTANRPHVIWQSPVRRVSTPRDLCNVCGRQGSRMQRCITAPINCCQSQCNYRKKKSDLFLMLVSHLRPHPLLICVGL